MDSVKDEWKKIYGNIKAVTLVAHLYLRGGQYSYIYIIDNQWIVRQ